MKKSLERLQQDNVDIIYLHRPDWDVPLKEQISVMNELIENDYAYYWGTSEFPADYINEIMLLSEKHGWASPIVEQCEYNMLSRKRFEVEYASIFDNYGIGTTTWSALYGGMLSGKYNNGDIPGDSRFGINEWGLDKSIEFLRALGNIANEVGCTQAQLAIAWVLWNKDVSTALIGATSLKQLDDNLGAINVAKNLDQQTLDKIEALLDNRPTPALNYRLFTPGSYRR